MITAETPFGRDACSLGLCSLRRLEREPDADLAARTLAGMDPWRTLGYSHRGLFQYLSRLDPALHRYLVEVPGQCAGLVCVRYPWLFGPCLELLALFPSSQKIGIGSTLLQWIEKEVQASSRNIWTLVSSFNTSAQAFYQKAGFVPVAHLDALVAVEHTEVLLRKRL